LSTSSKKQNSGGGTKHGELEENGEKKGSKLGRKGSILNLVDTGLGLEGGREKEGIKT